jgi:YidC/Oxa1 family membrane protein insertase
LFAAWNAPSFIVNPMRLALDWFVNVTGSYGVGIILLTIAVRVLILPLTIYQTKSMKRLQEVQPLMKEIQEKYKDQPEKLQQEMMSLYRTHGVNPLSGCLPLLIQMPFFLAIFTVLREFHPPAGIPHGFLWVPDLGAKDPMYILPALTMLSMYLQSWLSGAGSDPNQKMMMYLMPLLFAGITFQMQAGVVLYWVVSTAFGLVQQAIYPGFPRFKGGVDPKGAAGAR